MKWNGIRLFGRHFEKVQIFHLFIHLFIYFAGTWLWLVYMHVVGKVVFLGDYMDPPYALMRGTLFMQLRTC